MKKILVYFLVAFIGGFAAVSAYKIMEPPRTTVQTTVGPTAAKLVNYSTGMGTPTAAPFDFTYAAEKTLPSVVHIQATQKMSRRAADNQGFDMQQIPEQFRDFFRNPNFQQQPGRQGAPEQQLRQGTGSGVIISADGYIVTNNHVVADADELLVALGDHRTYPATVIGADPSTDIALIKIDEKDLPAIPFYDSDKVKVGEWVLAVGNPFDLESTVTAGIVSAKGRSININQDQSPIESFIQTDAAINPGNSGGALVNLNGELVGINSAIASPTGSYAGYGFAVPSDIVKKVVADLKEYGVVQRGFIGAIIRNNSGDLAKDKGFILTTGVYVDSLAANSAAAAAGLKAGDLITAVDGQSTSNVPQVLEMIGRHRPGDKVKIDVLRKDQPEEIWVTLKNRAGNTEVVKKDSPSAILHVLGADLETLSAADAKSMGIPGGVKVNQLNNGRLLDQTDMQEGFVITKVDGKKVESVEEMGKALENLKGGVMIEGMYPGNPEVYYYAFGLPE